MQSVIAESARKTGEKEECGSWEKRLVGGSIKDREYLKKKIRDGRTSNSLYVV